jgi:ATP-binding cassette subfamily B (MDR/TAP) protein 1
MAAVSQFETVASLAAEKVVFEKYNGQLNEARGSAQRMAWVSSALFALAQANMYFVIALGFWYGSTLVYSGEVSSRAFFAVFTAIVAGSFQAVNVLTQAPELSQARGAALEIGRLLKIESQKSGGIIPTVPQGDTRLDSVSFTYPSRGEPSLIDLSLLACHHGLTAICGPSGSGKSTVIHLLQRFYEPNSGAITMAGQPINSIDESAFRKSVALVSQEPVLFNMTIRENILLGAETRATDHQIWDVLKPVNLDTFVRELPDGLDTDLGAKGLALSGGQRQRLVLARALLRRPSLLLLDEATSSLDHANQRAVQTAIDTLARDPQHPLTVISVAHRLSTIHEAEVIYVMRSGRLVESGGYDQLVDRGGLFASLVISGGS